MEDRPGETARRDSRWRTGQIVAGRYRLDEHRPTDLPGAERWDATDQILARGVTLTLLTGPRTGAAVDGARRAALVVDARLARILDVGAVDGTGYVVTEPAEGRTLASLVATAPLAADQARAVVGEVAAALEAARRRGVHHLALRPSAVRITTAGRVVLDGLAVDGELLATTGGGAHATSRTDTVGLVRLLYTALTGYWPVAPGAERTTGDLPSFAEWSDAPRAAAPEPAAGPLADVDTGLPLAPETDGGPVPPGELVAGLPADLDTLCTVTLGPHDDGPHSPGELVRELEPWRAVRADAIFQTADAGRWPSLSGGSGGAAGAAGARAAGSTGAAATAGAALGGAAGAALGGAAGAALGGAAGAAGIPAAPPLGAPMARPAAPARTPVSARTAPAGTPRVGPATGEPSSAEPTGATIATPEAAEPAPTTMPVPADLVGAEEVDAPAIDAPAIDAEPASADPAPSTDPTAPPTGSSTMTDDPRRTPNPDDESGSTAAPGTPVARQSVRSAFAQDDGPGTRRPGTPPPATPAPASFPPAAATPVRTSTRAAGTPPTIPPGTAAGTAAPPAAPAAVPPSQAQPAAAFPPAVPPTQPAPAGEGSAAPWELPFDGETPRRRSGQRRLDPTRWVLGLVALAVVVVVVIAIGNVLAPWRDSADDTATTPPVVATQPAGEQTADAGAQAPAATVPPQIAAIGSVDPSDGDGEHEELVGRITDGDPATAWYTHTYNRPDFAGFKDGVGLVITLAQPATVTSITLDVNGTGGNVEVRSTDAANPTTGDVLASGPMNGQTVLTLAQPTETQSIVLWFTSLSQTADGANRIEISGLTVS